MPDKIVAPTTSMNYDVLLHVIAMSSQETGTALMSTCRLLYHEGAKFVCRNPAGLETEQRLVSFLTFLSAEADMIRCRYIRRLDLWIFGMSPAVAESLINALRHMHFLESLIISHSELVLASHPDLPQQIAALKPLKHITLSYAGPLARTLLLTLNPP
ncbi:hypothetical protein C8Q76DRAFT_138819 [Earliella scabrosa]|nr:hypothetical protein C8Q76DRAFT_138819 [Earliella scabrosa]